MIDSVSTSYLLLLGLAIILITGLFSGKISKLLKIPNVTGYLLGGFLIGPAFLALFFPSWKGLISENYVKGLEIFLKIQLGFIAFSIGSEFKMSYFKQVGPMPIIIAFAESFAAVLFIFLGTLATLAILGVSMSIALPFALCLGAVGGATAPAATVMVLKQYKANGPLSKAILSVVAIDDASALIFFGFCMAAVKALTNSSSNIAWTLAMPLLEIISSLVLGIVSGIIITLLMKAFTGRGNRTSLTIAMIFANIGLCLLIKDKVTLGGLHPELSSLLSCMAMGAVFTNYSKAVDDVMPLIDRITPPFVLIFFVISGADLRFNALTWVAIIILFVYLIFRVAGKVCGTMVSAKATKAPVIVRKYLGWGLLPQGGIAIGLSLIVMEVLPESFNETYNGMLIRLIVICAVFISEIFGPLCLKYALLKSKEGHEEPRKKKEITKTV